MGEEREDRLQVRLTYVLLPAVALGATLFVPAGILHGDVGRFVVTFLGLIAASILPTITLLVGSMTSVGRSVLRITQLRDEFSGAVAGLWSILVSIALAVGGLALSSVDRSAYTAAWPASSIVETAFYGLQSVGVGLFFTFGVDAVIRFRHIPTVIRRALDIKYEIAVEDARKRADDRAPNKDEIAEKFGTSKGFGAVVQVKLPEKMPQ